MRRSSQLCKQHMGWHFQRKWKAQSARKVVETQVESKLVARGIPVVRAEDLLKPKHEHLRLDIAGQVPRPIARDETHPLWQDRVLLTYKDNNVLLEGLSQAKNLLNTVEITSGLPDLSILPVKGLDGRIKEIIKSAHIYDAEQVKLPKVKDPLRPAWNFPRSYGITQPRVIKLLLTNLLHLIESSSPLALTQQRYLVEDALFSYNFERGTDLIQLELRGDMVLTSSKPLKRITDQETTSFELPNIFPLSPIISLTKENIYELRGIYPIDLKFDRSHPHTIFVAHIETEVQNIHEEAVTDEQIYGYSLIKAFTAAASYARKKYGGSVKTLPEPVTIQCVNTNGRLFHFGVFQLNTLDLEQTEVRNIWFQTERIPLFEECRYKNGRPILEGYNSEAVQIMQAFYNNV